MRNWLHPIVSDGPANQRGQSLYTEIRYLIA